MLESEAIPESCSRSCDAARYTCENTRTYTPAREDTTEWRREPDAVGATKAGLEDNIEVDGERLAQERLEYAQSGTLRLESSRRREGARCMTVVALCA